MRPLGCFRALAAALVLQWSGQATQAASILSTMTYKSSVTSDAGGKLDLKAELNYESTRSGAPIAVVMHGYSGSTGKAAEVRANAQRLRDAGFFVVSVSLRGRDGSDGVRDSGGVEIYDIYDAVEYVKATYPTRVNASNVSITGYSGGGGNAMSALTKFPDYFRAGSSYFGMGDYGYDAVNGWYANGSDSSHRSQMVADIGNPALNNATIQDRFQSRASNLASANNPYSEIHLFVNQNEPTCPPVNVTKYRDTAIAAATSPGEFDNITVHIGGTGQYVDFNNNGVNEASELQNWPHGYPDANQQNAGESWYLSRLLNGSIPQPVLNLQDELVVAGFVTTKRFSLWLGDGQNSVGDLSYDLTGNDWSFELGIASNVKTIEGTLKVDTSALAGQPLAARLNGVVIEQLVGGGSYQLANFGDNDILTLSVTAPGDFNGDGQVNSADLNRWKSNFPISSGATAAAGDGDGDGDVDGVDFLIWQEHVTAPSPSPSIAVPEPLGLGLTSVAASFAAVAFRRRIARLALSRATA
ncbi:prolyl oligopeptidase family serine peptidase [Lacipirellula sp.]|uniref:prolyl oligopeptidase family serine peptidase n=1 Tax=Lacipirellula sp. TaxID=2691419 RepID=UPI003D13F1C8